MQEISLNILDLAQNSITAGATLINIDVIEDPAADTLSVELRDNGRGMTRQQVGSVTDPFYTTRTTRKVGLGIPFFKMAAEMSGGSFSIDSEPGAGTRVKGVFGLSNIDRMPLGDMCGTMTTLIGCNPAIDFVYTRARGEKQFTLDTREMRRILGGVALDGPEVIEFVREFLSENEKEITGGALDHEIP